MAKLDGKWNMVVKTPQHGDIKNTVEFLVSGSKLTGKVSAMSGALESSVDNGKVSGDGFSYSVTIMTPNGTQKNELEGKISPDGSSISGTTKNSQGVFNFTGKRA